MAKWAAISWVWHWIHHDTAKLKLPGRVILTWDKNKWMSEKSQCRTTFFNLLFYNVSILTVLCSLPLCRVWQVFGRESKSSWAPAITQVLLTGKQPVWVLRRPNCWPEKSFYLISNTIFREEDKKMAKWTFNRHCSLNLKKGLIHLCAALNWSVTFSNRYVLFNICWRIEVLLDTIMRVHWFESKYLHILYG